MKLRTLFGILSVAFWLLAVLTVVLPVASVVANGLVVTPNQVSPSSSSNSVPTSYQVSNHGFLAIDGVYLSVSALGPDNIRLYEVQVGPVDLPPGSSVQMKIATPDLNSFYNSTSPLLAGLKSITLQATVSANFGGLIPVSASADFVVPLNGSASG
jgi:hypothetical protein